MGSKVGNANQSINGGYGLVRYSFCSYIPNRCGTFSLEYSSFQWKNSPVHVLHDSSHLGPREPTWAIHLVITTLLKGSNDCGCLSVLHLWNAPNSQISIHCLTRQHVGLLLGRRAMPADAVYGRRCSLCVECVKNMKRRLNVCNED
jgi:hypothetical protein